jgi:PAS domain S-box-containing protein
MDAIELPSDISPLLLQKAADHAFHAITITRADHEGQPGEIIYVNDAFTELTGYSAEAVVGETPSVLQGPKTEQDVLDRLGRKLDAGEVFHGRTVNYRKDGSEFMMEWKVIPVEMEASANYYVAVQREAPASS